MSIEKGSLIEAIDNISQIDLSRFDHSVEGIYIKEFYTNLLNAFTNAKNNGRSGGDRNFISRVFQEELSKTIGKMSTNLDFISKEKDIANGFLRDLKKKKNIDLYVNGGDGNKIAIEIKTTLDFNPLGEACLEALVTSENFNKFYVVSLCCTEATYNKLNQIIQNIPEIKNIITDIVSFVFYHKATGFENGVIKFFEAIRNASINKKP